MDISIKEKEDAIKLVLKNFNFHYDEIDNVDSLTLIHDLFIGNKISDKPLVDTIVMSYYGIYLCLYIFCLLWNLVM